MMIFIRSLIYRSIDKSTCLWYISRNMFDKIIYKLLNTIVRWCESYKEYRIKRSLPRATYDEKARNAEVKKWANQRENSYK